MDRQEELQSTERETRDKGFTLIELLIVIVILGILSTIVVLSVRGITDQGKTSACSADLKTLEIAQEAAAAKGLTLTYGTPTAAEDQLVTAQLLRTTSSKYNITGDTSIVAVAGSGCEVVATGATAGAPGSFTPSGALAPADLAALNAAAVSTTFPWAAGAFIVLGDATQAHPTSATTWAVGPAT